MADKQISDLTSASQLTDGSLFVLEQAGAAMKANWGMMKNYISPSVAAQYSTSATYNEGDYVMYNGSLYRCNTAITTAESWTAAHWTSVVIGDDISDIIRAFVSAEFPSRSIIDARSINFGNNSALTSNGDGTYTVGTSDYGRTAFGLLTTLQPGTYLLYGVPGCRCYLSPDGSWAARIAGNTSGIPKAIIISEAVSVYLCFAVTAPPSSQFTIRPYLYNAKISDAFRFMGNCPTDLDSMPDAGYYINVNGSTHSPKPSEYNATNGVIINLPKVMNNTYGLQILFDSSSVPNVWVRLCKSDGTSTISTMPWTRVLNDSFNNTVKTNLQKISQKGISLSGNYFDWQNAEWLDGFDNGSSIQSGTGYHYAFAPLQGAGNYIRVMNPYTFGINAGNICLFDKDKNRIKVLVGTRIGDSLGYAFTLSEEDALTAAYITMNYRESDNYYYSGLYYESSAYPLLAGRECPLPNYKASDIYKKVVVADGDSIAAAGYDFPLYRKGWWGRIVTDYSCSGKDYAVGGGTITDFTEQSVGGNPRHCISLDIDTIHSEYAALDYLILDGGTNDADLVGQFSGDTPPARFGTWAETDFSGSYDTTKFCGAVEYMFYKALNYWPKAKIGFIIPMEMGTNNSTVSNRRRYYDEIVKIAKKWHIPVLDLWNESQMDARLSAFYDSTMTSEQNVSAGKCYYDGQHPTSYGYNLMQAKIDSWVNSL